GGIISVAGEIHKAGDSYREARLAGIATRIEEILEISAETQRSTTRVANELVDQVLADAAGTNIELTA
ncbi:MAG: amino acid dehydrogenase, partial [Pseudomonadota bacterium]